MKTCLGRVSLHLTILTAKDHWEKKPFEDIVEKGANAGNQHFLLSHNVFYPAPQTNLAIFDALKSFQNNNNLALTKLKAFNVTYMMISASDRQENVAENGEMLVSSIFSFSMMFSKAFLCKL